MKGLVGQGDTTALVSRPFRDDLCHGYLDFSADPISQLRNVAQQCGIILHQYDIPEMGKDTI